MLSEKDSEYVLQSYDRRKKQVEKVLNLIGYRDPLVISKIKDTKGNTSKIKDYEALVLTKETLEGGILVNEARKENILKELKII